MLNLHKTKPLLAALFYLTKCKFSFTFVSYYVIIKNMIFFKKGCLFLQKNDAIVLKNITKKFGDVVANNNISLTVKSSEILSLLGENGSGKTTLMNMLSGIYFPDSGEIFINGKKVIIRSPKDAFNFGIGMIHQHFKLVDVLTVAENIILGLEGKGNFDIKAISKEIKVLSEKYGFDIDPFRKVYDLSVSEKQTVEILKVLYRGANILILDEPTAVLTPQETEKLFNILRKMRDEGKAIIIITHKLNEVLEISDSVAVLRKGEYIGTVKTKEADTLSLTEMMVGKKVTLDIQRPEYQDKKLRLMVKNLTCFNEEELKVVDNVSFEAFGGEILGIAGIAGSGQKELLEAIAGLVPINNGAISYIDPKDNKEKELVGLTPLQIRELGVALSFVPEDRLGMGLVGSMDLTDNMMLKSYNFSKNIFTNRKHPKKLAEQIIKRLEIITPSITTPVSKLSGGNVQKVLLGREIAANPSVLMAAYPVRGLDINSSYTVYELLNKQKVKGVAVIFVGEDLDVLLELCDRILVICAGKVSGIVDAKTATKEQIGLMMTNAQREDA